MKKFALISIVILVVMLTMYGCGGNDSKDQSNSGASQGGTVVNYKDITAEELKTMIAANKNLIVVDVREQYEWDEGHLAGSVLIPIGEVQRRVSELPKEKAIAIVCLSGARSAQVANYLIELGYKEVYNLKDGISSWSYELVK